MRTVAKMMAAGVFALTVLAGCIQRPVERYEATASGPGLGAGDRLGQSLFANGTSVAAVTPHDRTATAAD